MMIRSDFSLAACFDHLGKMVTGTCDKLEAANTFVLAPGYLLRSQLLASGPREMSGCPEQWIFPSHSPEMCIHQKLFAVMSFIKKNVS